LRVTLNEKTINKARRNLKKHLDLLGPLRDTQIQLSCVEELCPRFPELAGAIRTAAKREKKLAARIGKKVKRTKVANLKELVVRSRKKLAARPVDASVRQRRLQALRGAVDSAFESVVERRRAINPRDPATIHRMRVAFKEFRYRVEIMNRVLPQLSARRLMQMNEFQRVMGDIQDIEVVFGCLEDVERKKENIGSLRRVHEYLARRRDALVTAFLQSADCIYSLWEYPRSRANER
jgi:CHAD domain-containing protein